jgi:hypothetical protein
VGKITGPRTARIPLHVLKFCDLKQDGSLAGSESFRESVYGASSA